MVFEECLLTLVSIANRLSETVSRVETVSEAETVFLFVDGTFRKVLAAGRHRFFSPTRVRLERVSEEDPLVRFADIGAILEKPDVVAHTTSAHVEEGRLGLAFRRGVFWSFLPPGRHVFAGHRDKSGITIEVLSPVAGGELQHPAETSIVRHTEAARYFKLVRVDAGTLGLLYVDGVLIRSLSPGRHALFETGQTLRIDTVRAFEPVSAPAPSELVRIPEIAEALVSTVVGDAERGLVFAGQNFRRFLASGAYYFLRSESPALRIEIVDARDPAFSHSALPALRRSADVGAFLTTFTVGQGQVGILFVDGAHSGRLPPGAHSFWNGQKHVHVDVVDLREQGLEVSGQELLTSDKVSLRLNLSVRYRIVDPEKAVLGHAGYAEAFHRVLQLALRDESQKVTLDELLSRKDDLGKCLSERAKEGAAALGIEIVSAGLRDVILPGEMRQILNQLVEAERRAQANLITRREETAATRSLLNTARLLDENPTLMRLKELEHAERIAEKIGHLSIIGGIDALVPKIREALGDKK